MKNKTPRRSLSDSKEYKFVKLSNGLKVLLVRQETSENDDKVKKKNLAAVALCVGSGCFQDPLDVQGMSHFLEHMIFMGSEKYPKENEFDQYVAAHGGFDNAYTECEHTLFHFDIIEKHLAGALDRFSQFFISPLMSIQSMEREMEAVESEFQSNSSDDEVRLSQIFCSMVNETHPASNFIWGNLRTLRNAIVREKLNKKLHEFRTQNYVANRMFLCIQSSVDMTRLERTVVKYFTDIPRGRDDLQVVSVPKTFEIFKPNFYEKAFFVKSTTEKCKLLLTFLLPAVGKDLKFLEYIASLIAYEGTGSLSDLFMDELLALKVKAKVGSQSFEGNSMFTLFTIEVNLTSKGFRDFDEVLKGVFAYLLLLKTTSMDEHKKRYEEFRENKETLLRYHDEKSAIENVQELAVNMRYFNDDDVIIGRESCPDFDEKTMKTMIDSINEKKFNLMVLSDKYPRYDKIERWFGTEYTEIDFPQAFTKFWNQRWLISELCLPKHNEFLCKNFGIFHIPLAHGESPYPQKIFADKSCECFYKLDRKFKLPHGFIYVFLSSSVTESSVQNLNMTSIFSMCVKNSVSDQLYPATIAGYSYKLHSVDNGLILRLSGFNEKLPLIVDIVTKTIKNLVTMIDKNVFETFKRELKKNCHNCLVDENLLNDDCRLSILKKHHRSFFDRHDNVDCLKFHDFKEFCENFTESLQAKILIQGNFIESRALYITQLIICNLSLKTNDEMLNDMYSEMNKIPRGSSVLKVPSIRHNDKNSIIKNYYQLEKSTIHDEVLAEFIVSVINEPLFDALRSREQLGYGVSCTLRKNFGVLGISITVEYQENKNCVTLIDNKIEEFLRSFYQVLKALTQLEVAAAKRSMVSVKMIDDTDLEKEVIRNWNEIRTGEFVFDRNDLEAFEIEKLTTAEIVQFYKETFMSSRRKLSIQVVGNVNQSDVEVMSEKFISELRDCKKKLVTFDVLT